MNKSSVQTSPSPPLVAPAVRAGDGEAPRPASRRRESWVMRKVLRPLASLRLTVVLFTLSLALVFFGTLAQIDGGIWTVVAKYFRSFFVWIPLQLLVQFAQIFFWVPKTVHLPGAFPFPGGWLLGGALLVNLLAAHAVRFKFSWKRAGILVIHAGVIVLLLGELFTGLFAVEGVMIITEGESANYVDHNRFSELVVTRPVGPEEDREVVVPGSLLRKGGPVAHDDLPFNVEVVKYMINSKIVKLEDDEDSAPATAGAGLTDRAVELSETSGVAAKQTVEMPAAYVRLTDKESGADLGTYLVAIRLKGQPVTVDGKTYDVALRFQRSYKPFSLHLIKFRFDRYMGTDKPKNFSSQVRLVDPERGEDREVVIRMNEPLHHRGETFYQADWDKDTEKTTYLQVVRNPAWTLPYVSCVMVWVGMMVHFGMNLVTFLQRRAA